MSDLNGANAYKPIKLTPPSQLANKARQNAQGGTNSGPIDVNKLKEQTQKVLSSDNVNMSNVVASGLAGGIGSAIGSQTTGVVGESMRSVKVQNSMTTLQSNMNSGGGWFGGGNNSYNSGYGGYSDPYADYGATEFVRRRGYGRIEFTRNGAKIENTFDSPETQLGMRGVANGALQGAKYGAILGGGMSAIKNGYNVITGKERGADALGAVAADTVSSALSGSMGAGAGSLATLGLGMVGIGGLPGIVLGVGVGAVGAVATQLTLNRAGLYDSIKDKVTNMVNGKK
jgi:hypothetical protein